MNSTRRTFLLSGAAVAVLGAFGLNRLAGAQTVVGTPGKVRIHQFSDMGKSIGIVEMDKVVKTEEEWRTLLANAPAAKDGRATAFTVTRQEDTEYSFSGPYWDNHEPGLYRCICCDNALYTNDAKYDSGTGWPSFWQPIAPENVRIGDAQNGGHKLWCALCDAHLGHVFNDGPPPTGLRHCIDGVALRYIPWPQA
jgi:peptide-methionine (R)-S-oxide reductase